MHTQQLPALIGTWTLLRVEVRYADGSVLYPWGQQPVGQLMYNSDGYMSVVIMRADRAPFRANDILGGSVEEQAAAARTYLSYSGSYEIVGTQVLHHITASLFPNWVGADQERFIEEVTGERLVLRTAPLLASGQLGTGYLTWQRAPER